MITVRVSSNAKFRNEADRDNHVDVDEETPLLRPVHDSEHYLNATTPRKETPIPWGHYSLVLFLQLAEPLTSQVIYPFIPQVCPFELHTSTRTTSDILSSRQLIREIGVTNGDRDDTKVGYYVGLMVSLRSLVYSIHPFTSSLNL